MVLRHKAIRTKRTAETRPETDVAFEPDAYERWRRSRLGSITETLESAAVFEFAGELQGRRFLDVGCGDGAYLVEAARRGAIAVGVDPSQPMLDAAGRRAADAGVTVDLHHGRGHELPFPDEAFDVAIAVTALCVVPDATETVCEMLRVLKPGGLIVVGELGRWNTWAAVRRVRGWLGSPIWRHTTFRSARQLRTLMTQAGADRLRTRGAIFYPPNGAVAKLLARVDNRISRITSAGAAFLVVAGTKPKR